MPDTLTFRAEVRDWLAAHTPRDPVPPFYTPDRREFDAAWQRALFHAGLGAWNWPEEFGGTPISTGDLVVFHEEMAAAGAPEPGCLFIALSHAGPTVVAWGTPEQQAAHVPAILRGDQVWCQGFSEPEAGSDLASIRTTARVDGDRLVVTGRKIWTSYGPLADYCELLVRTDATAGRHRGLTWVILDMHSPGVEVRPIQTVTGNPRFSEVTLDEVAIPLANVVGELDGGWRVAMSTLGFERGSAMVGRQIRTRQKITELRALAVERGALGRAGVQAALADCERDAVVMRAMVDLSLDGATRVPADGSILRVFHSELVGRLTRLAMEILAEDVAAGDPWVTTYLDELRSKVTAGTLDIQRNIIGERHLGLPR